ncbi:hypothetical protein [Xanthomonas phage Xp15]|uniref:Uncharacterized protein n=1 Tax=Xanthomonas phage Xp15 TaxID=322855 RepID=Q52PT8_9CAUD|nr:hypothetical protein XPXV15_gp73 [Xanthomonas phage Xp15]AAX84909.1 hypothetical protein [Xanthomonas phage Xp15]
MWIYIGLVFLGASIYTTSPGWFVGLYVAATVCMLIGCKGRTR